MNKPDQDTLRQTTTLTDLLDLLCNCYDWPLGNGNLEDVTFDFTPDELAISDEEAVGVRQIKQLRPLSRNQPWGVFFLDFERKRLPVGVLRRILRSLVRRKRERVDRAHRPSWALEDLLFICSHKADDESGFTFVHFAQPREPNRAARLTSFGWTPTSHNRTVLEFNLPALRWPDDEENTENWRKSWLGAFDKEKLTQVFYEDYERLFKEIRRDLTKKTTDSLAHEYSLQLLNRMMFMYFIQRKGWIGNDKEFLRTFWETYKDANQPKDTFHEMWLGPLFFEAFNNTFRPIHRHFPEPVRHALQLAPYLNGGLFTKNKLDDEFHGKLSDERFERIFDFLDHYNFTISEDTPLDIEVAVDTEMLGRVYENLVNTDETTDERGQAGIFYTPRIEIDLMCRLALVDNMANNMGEKHRNLFYEFVFAIEESDKVSADASITKKDLWVQIDEYLRKVTILDPACGSGSFLVGMLNILNDLCKRANKELHRQETEYQRKKRIIGEQLYGVDVKHWAVHIAELRLWLNLIIESDLEVAELTIRETPLLPNLTFKVQPGDSLVQEIGGFSLANLTKTEDIGPALKNRIKSLQQTKVDYFRGTSEKDKTDARVIEIRKEELALFRDILKALENSARRKLDKLCRDLEEGKQKKIFDEEDEASRQARKFGEEWRKRKEELESAIETIENARGALRESKEVPFVWDIAFVEVFGGDSKGFDIVIGNPPYVRQEAISDPLLPRDRITTENKREYKDKLIRSVYAKYPWFFGINPQKPEHKIDAKSDLYIYFYFHGLSLLNPQGSFCFITSNSWLDVGYGKDLQEFLLRQSHVKMILDNQVKRSFASADVNTIIALLAPPNQKTDSGLSKIARFVMFKVPFEYALSPVVFEEIEEADDRKSTPEFRVNPIKQETLLDEGWSWPEETDEDLIKKLGRSAAGSKYTGNKWGGKYLRAPDIYWTILEKGKGKLVRLGDIAEVRRGFTTGANEFFYLDADKIEEWGIEKEFLKPVIKSPRECKSILINPADLKYKLFMCHKDKNDLKGTRALEYIKWGEKQGFHERPSCRGRLRWWDLGERRKPHLMFNYLIDSTAKTLYASSGCFCSDNFQEIHLPDYNLVALCTSLNSTVFQLMVNMAGRSNFGGGLLKIQTYEVADLLCLSPNFMVRHSPAVLEGDAWDVVQVTKCREALDKAVFESIGLSKNEQLSVYKAVKSMVEYRLNKVGSV